MGEVHCWVRDDDVGIVIKGLMFVRLGVCRSGLGFELSHSDMLCLQLSQLGFLAQGSLGTLKPSFCLGFRVHLSPKNLHG